MQYASETELAALRHAYARQMLERGQAAGDAALEAAFGRVRREDFLGPGPWRMVALEGGGRGYRRVEADPRLAYQDALFALDAERGVNNGSPSLHARMLHALAPRAGQRVVHIGAGSGYYTAIIAELVGAAGQALAVEFDEALAAAARRNLAAWPQVRVAQGDGAEWPQQEADAVYVNFSVGRPAWRWLDMLAEGGRLVLPLGVAAPPWFPGGPRHDEHGAVFVITRAGQAYAARALCPTWFVHAEGALATDGEEVEALRTALTGQGLEFVQSLRRPGTGVEPRRCWFWSPGWALCYDPPS